MNTLDVLLRALSKNEALSLPSEKSDSRKDELFADFGSDDEIIAAFLDGKLTPQQSNAVKQMLVERPSLRQLWLASASTEQKQRALGQTSAVRGKRAGMRLSMVASVAMLAAVLMVLAVRNPELWQPTQLADTTQPEPIMSETSRSDTFASQTLTPETDAAPQLASQAVPLMAWQTFLEAYQSRGEESGREWQQSNDYASFAILAAALVALEGACADDKALALAQQHFVEVVEQYPAVLTPMTPIDRQQWCGLGKTLQQYASLAVSSSSTD